MAGSCSLDAHGRIVLCVRDRFQPTRTPYPGCWMSTVIDVSDENYKEFTDGAGAVVAYGLATCEPCQAYDAILEKTAAKFPTIKVGKAKMHIPGRCRAIKKIHSFETYPTTHFFAHGKLLLTREGIIEPAELDKLITALLLK